MYQKSYEKLYLPKQIVPAILKRQMLIIFPFFGKCYMNLRTRLYKSVSKIWPQCNIKVIFYSKNWFSSLFKFKDYICFYLCFHLVCKFYGSNIIYYGKTERDHKVKAGECISKFALRRKRINNNKQSAVKDQCVLSDRVYPFDDFELFHFELWAIQV